MQRHELVRWLDDLLNIRAIPDASLNGLQVEGGTDVNHVAVAVDASKTAIEQAASVGADFLIVHHGLFWGGAEPITGMTGARVRLLMENNISLYAAHLPLDAHPEVGNNWGLAELLGLDAIEPFAEASGHPIGARGTFPNPVSLRELADQIEEALGESVLVHAGGPMEVQQLGIVSGSGSSFLHQAADLGLDALLSGEPKHDNFHVPFERGLSALYAGHYMTETVGVKRLAERIEVDLGLSTEFLLLPTGL
jgi:dinuclear metal center YbgI/SA1388 family protein